VSWLVLAAFAAVLPPLAAHTWRRPLRGLYVLGIGLALHNVLFMLLYGLGAHGWQLTVAQSWKECILAVAITRVGWDAWRSRRLPFALGAGDVAALLYACIVVIYLAVPQSVLGGEATVTGKLYAVRHLLLPVVAYTVGRAVMTAPDELSRLVSFLFFLGPLTAVVGIAEEYVVPVEGWVAVGAPDYFHQQLGFPEGYGPGRLPENFVLNTTDAVYRRLVSMFLSPLGSAYLFVTLLSLAATGTVERLRRDVVIVGSLLTFSGLLFTFTRSAVLALAGSLALLAPATRRAQFAAAAPLVVAAGLGFAAVFPTIAPRTHFLPEDAPRQEALFAQTGVLPGSDPLEFSLRLADPSARSHLAELARGMQSLLTHPQGYGPGNSGQTALRSGVPLRAGESFYLEVGADLGLVGLALWFVVSLLVLRDLFRRARSAPAPVRSLAAGVFAAMCGLSAVAVVSDVWGSPWPTYVLWWLAGSVVSAFVEAPSSTVAATHG
jgi:O-antigen ligase